MQKFKTTRRVLAVLLSLVIGTVNGCIVTFFKIPAIIATLGASWVYQGISYTLCNAQPIYGFPESFSTLGQGRLLGIPIPVYLFVLMSAIASFVFNKTSYGRSLYAVGSNSDASYLSGINVNLMKVSSYIICSLGMERLPHNPKVIAVSQNDLASCLLAAEHWRAT